MATKEYKAIFVPLKVHKAIKVEATRNGKTMIEDLSIKYKVNRHYKNMEDTFKQERQEWEAKHPGQDYDVYINSRVDEEKENLE